MKGLSHPGLDLTNLTIFKDVRVSARSKSNEFSRSYRRMMQKAHECMKSGGIVTYSYSDDKVSAVLDWRKTNE